MLVLYVGDGLRAEPHGLGPARLRRRRRPRGGAAGRHRDHRVLLSVYLAAGLIYGLTAWILIGRVGVASPNNLDRREPRQHHRRRDRRHQPVRRPRRGPRHAARRPDRAGLPERPRPRRGQTTSTRCWPWESSSLSPSRSTSGSGRYADESEADGASTSSAGQATATCRDADARGTRHGQDVRPRRRPGRRRPQAATRVRCSRSSATTAPASRR